MFNLFKIFQTKFALLNIHINVFFKLLTLLTCTGRSQNCWTPGNHIRAVLSTSTISTGWPCLFTRSSCIFWMATVPSVLPSLSSNSTYMQCSGSKKNTDLVHLLDDVFPCYLDVSIDHPLPLPRYQITTSLRKVVLTRNLASSSTRSNSSSFERGHSILSAIHKI